MNGERCDDRTILELTGGDREEFLQGLVSNDLARLAGGLVYAALLSPQGKYLADFFLVPQDGAILIDVKTDLAAGLMQRLNMYRLRADVRIGEAGLFVTRGLGDPPEGGFADPRHPDLGWRYYSTDPGDSPQIDWDAIRVAHCIPETGIELTPDSYILESRFEALNGVDFRKGCYVGQEVTARMKHKTSLRKGLTRVAVEGNVPSGTEIATADGKPAGTLFTQSGGQAIAYLRFDRAGPDMRAGAARVSWTP